MNNPVKYADPWGLVVSPWDMEHLTPGEQAKLAGYTDDWNIAYAAGDEEGMQRAHEAAEALRSKYRNENEVTLDNGYTISMNTESSNQIIDEVNSDINISDDKNVFFLEESAVLDFAQNNIPITNEKSIERGTYLYKTTINDIEYYFYNDSMDGGHDNVILNAVIDYGVGIVKEIGSTGNISYGIASPVAFMHTHPYCTGHIGEEFSLADEFLTKLPGIETVYLVTPKGYVYAFDKGMESGDMRLVAKGLPAMTNKYDCN